jgi:hypothetical protein
VKKKGVSEEIFVDELVKKNNINVQKLSSDTLNPWNRVEEVIYFNDEPILSFSAVNHFNMMEKIKKLYLKLYIAKLINIVCMEELFQN